MPKGLAGSGITLCRSFLHRQEPSMWLMRRAEHCRSPAARVCAHRTAEHHPVLQPPPQGAV